ncbi:MAG: AAA family ATPase [bacterium]|nr:AAA family ATPase [bacterium]
MNVLDNLLPAPPPHKGVRRIISRHEAEKLLPKACEGEMDPYFPNRGVSCGEEHLKYLLQVVWPLLQAYRSVIVGQGSMTTYTLLGMFAVGDRDPDHMGSGHVFYLGLPGTGKSLLAKVPQKVVHAITKRIQGTVDLLPADITGSNMVQIDNVTGHRKLEFIKGPIFANILLFDEASRTPARGLSGLLESMSEGQVTVNGVTYPADPFVIATGNPIESEGVHKLPDALLDRVMFQTLARPFTASDYKQILKRTRTFYKTILPEITDYSKVVEARNFFHETIHVSAEIEDFISNLAEVINSVDHSGLLTDLRAKLKLTADEAIIKPGSMIVSGRGVAHLEGAARALAALRYRNYLILADVHKVLLPVIRHRTHFTPNALSSLTRGEVRSELTEQFGRSGKTEMSEYILAEIIRTAWDHTPTKHKGG